MPAAPQDHIVHASFLVRREQGEWRGVLLRGASGTGKSDLGLRLTSLGWRLIADDRTLIWTDKGKLFGRCPAPIAGLIEVRGLGVVDSPVPVAYFGRVTLVAECCNAEVIIERIPDAEFINLLGVELPTIKLAALEASAPYKLSLACSRV